MKRGVLGIIIAVIALGAIAGVVIANNRSSNEPVSPSANTNESAQDGSHTAEERSETSQSEPAAKNEVVIADYEFAPETLTVKKGTTVTWTNQDAVKHDVTPDEESEDFKASDLLGKGESYSFTFNEAGTYAYHCSPHPYMKASVVVTE